MFLRIILFCLLFAFPIKNLPLLNSAYISMIFLFFYFFIGPKKYKLEVLNLLTKKSVLKILISLIGIISLSALVPIIHSTYDFSIIKTLLNQFIFLISVILIYPLIKNKGIKVYQILIDIFIIQACIQLISFLSPSFRESTNFFRSENTIHLGQLGYGYIRGLSLSGTSFFGLGVCYGIIFILYLFYWKKLNIKYNFIKVLVFILLLFGGLSAARTSMVSIPIILGILFLKNVKSIENKKIILTRQFKVRNLVYSFFMFSIAYIIFIISYFSDFFKRINLEAIEIFSRFAFQFYYNFVEKGTWSTSSTDYLFNSMYFKIPNKTLLIGDGRYTNVDGSYYLNTDSGLMRLTLFFGVLGVIFFFLYQFIFFNWKNKKTLLLSVSIFLFLTICQIKGETVGFLIMSQVMIFLLFCEEISSNSKVIKVGGNFEYTLYNCDNPSI